MTGGQADVGQGPGVDGQGRVAPLAPVRPRKEGGADALGGQPNNTEPARAPTAVGGRARRAVT